MMTMETSNIPAFILCRSDQVFIQTILLILSVSPSVLSIYIAGRLEISRPTGYWITHLGILLFIAGAGTTFFPGLSSFSFSSKGIVFSILAVGLAILFETRLPANRRATTGSHSPGKNCPSAYPGKNYPSAYHDIPTGPFLLVDQLKQPAWAVKSKQTVIQWMIIFALIGSLEEVCYRGIILQTILTVTNGAARVLLVIIQVLLFGLNHLFFGHKQVILKTLFGLTLTVITLWTGTIVPAMLAHSLFNGWAIYETNKQILFKAASHA